MFRNNEKRVQIVQEKIGSPGGVEHEFFIERVSDGLILGKYPASVDALVPPANGKGKPIEKKISGREAAEAACKVNGWEIVERR